MPLVAESLGVELGGKRVLGPVSASVAPGMITAVIGPNGAGKTTLLRAMLGLIEPCEGSARLDDVPVRSIPAARRSRRIAYIPHTPSVAFSFTVEQVVTLGLFSHPGSDVRGSGLVRSALHAVELADRAGESFSALSAGQRQRACLARALVQLDAVPGSLECSDPSRWLLADEPISAMDPRHAVAAMDLLRALARRGGLGVVAVLHDLTMASRFADRVLILSGSGEQVAHGPADLEMRPEVLGEVYQARFRVFGTPGIGTMIVAQGEPRTEAGDRRQSEPIE